MILLFFPSWYPDLDPCNLVLFFQPLWMPSPSHHYLSSSITSYSNPASLALISPWAESFLELLLFFLNLYLPTLELS